MRTFILAVCLSYFVLSLRADALRDRMDAYVRRYADGDFFSGVVRVTKGDRIIYENAFGYADRAWQVPNSLQTRFQIASLSKPMTAAAILLLAEEGKLSLKDKLSKFVPDFPNGARSRLKSC
jgi:CubicO group peptidase (beta-lactamase class C family)